MHIVQIDMYINMETDFNICQFLYFSFGFCQSLYNIHTMGSVLRLHMIRY